MGCQNSMLKQYSQHIETQRSFSISYRDMIKAPISGIFTNYKLSTVISRSMLSMVRKAIQRSTNQEKICKMISIKDRKLAALEQIDILNKLDYPNIVRITEYYIQVDNVYIIMQKANGKKLINQIIQSGSICVSDIRKIMFQLLGAIQYCHLKGLAHRQINLENIIMHKDSDKLFIKLVGFSMATAIGCPKPRKMFPFRNKSFEPLNIEIKNYDKLDIWGAGIVFYCLVTGNKPPRQFQQQPWSILDQKIKIQSDSQLKSAFQCIKYMVNLDAQLRPTARQCLNHQFFDKNWSMNKDKSIELFKKLSHFQIKDRLLSVFWMYASLNHNIQLDKNEYLVQFFNLDHNKDGSIDYSEFKQGIKNSFEISDEQLDSKTQKIFENLDKNKNGLIDYSEFVMGTIAVNKIVSEENLKRIFNEMDSNRNGTIQEIQLNNFVSGIEDFNLIEDKKYKLTFEEFKKMMKNVRDQIDQ